MNIKWIETASDKIFLNKEIFTKNTPKSFFLHFGAWEKTMNVEIDNDLPKDVIGLPGNLANNFEVPPHLPYEIYIQENNIYMGPVIAFFSNSKKSLLTPARLRQLKTRFLKYPNIKGLIYICAKDMINITDKTIEGYYYNPNATDEKDQWIYGIFPYPAAVFRRGFSSLDEKTYNDLYIHLGNKIFNAINRINKWELWSILSPYDSVRKHLPHTNQLKNIHSLDHMLDLYDYVYLKPYSLSQGKGIITVHTSTEGYHFIDRFKNETIIKDSDHVSNHLNKIMAREYVVQQAVPYKYKNRNVDFRLYLQKNKNKEWSCSGITTKISKEGYIVTNFNYRECLLTSHESLKKIYHLDDKAAIQKESEMINICINACKHAEQHVNHIGDVAIDLIVDENLKVWILEIQISYAFEERIGELPPKLYQKIMTTPFEYAKTLAGF